MTGNDRHFFNILMFYKDQDGNLYDTEHIESLQILQKNIGDKRLQFSPKNNGDNFIVERYYSYSKEEQRKLSNKLKPYSLELANLLK